MQCLISAMLGVFIGMIIMGINNIARIDQITEELQQMKKKLVRYNLNQFQR